ncbi:MAG: glycoside hydrolase family 3 protein [Treponema sp.]|nr:glycoside hydrolase family 3 protein [Treponema sp.]
MFCKTSDPLYRAIDDYLERLSPLQQIALLFLVNIDGDSAYRALEREDDETPLVPGGCLFFSYNVAPTADSLIAFTDSIASYCRTHRLARPYTAIDQEGGGVNRLKNVASFLPSPALVAQRLTPGEAYTLYSIQGEQMAALGFDLNLAPIVEAETAWNSGFLGRRAFGGGDRAAAYSLAALRAYQERGVLCAVKHFPGNSNADPHGGKSTIDIGEKELALSVYLPFSFALAASPAAVLMSHAIVPAVDERNPAVLSERWISGELKGRLGYKGLVISDDIFMGALSAFGMGELAVKAFRSGTDVLMLSDKYFKTVARALLDEAGKDPAFAATLHEAERHVVLFKMKAGILKELQGADGSLALVECTLEEQRGNAQERMKAFSDAKARGDQFYSLHFAGDGQ